MEQKNCHAGLSFALKDGLDMIGFLASVARGGATLNDKDEADIKKTVTRINEAIASLPQSLSDIERNKRIAEFATEWRLRDRAVTQAIVYGAPAWETASREHALKMAGLRLIAVIDGHSPDDYQLPAFCPGKMGDPVKAPRKIVQISAVGPGEAYCLCDDGTLWLHWRDHDAQKYKWDLIPDIPQVDVHAK